MNVRAGAALRVRTGQQRPGSRSGPESRRETSLPISQYLGGDAETVLLRLHTMQ